MFEMFVLLLLLIAASGALAAFFPPLDGSRTLQVTVSTKDQSSSNNPGGFASAYYINGVQQPELTFVADAIYTFNVSELQCDHPIYISGDFSGDGNQILDNSAATHCNGGTGGNLAWLAASKYTAQNLAAGEAVYYQCEFHSKMGWLINVVAVGNCDVLGDSLSKPEATLVTEIATSLHTRLVVNNEQGLGKYFDSQGPSNGGANVETGAAKTQFIDNMAKVIFQYYGCLDIDRIGAYTGDLQAIHASMEITDDLFDKHILVLQSAFEEVSGLNSAHPFTQQFVREMRLTRPFICNTNCSRTSICAVNADANMLTDIEFMSNITTELFSRVLDTSTQVGLAYSENGVTSGNSAAAQQVYQEVLADILGCDNGTTSGYNLMTIHENVTVTREVWDEWVFLFMQSLDALVPVADQDRIFDLLNATYRPMICNAPDCDDANPTLLRVSVVTKNCSAANPPTGWCSGGSVQGIGQGYNIDNADGPELTFEAGRTYRFRVDNPCSHPLYITNNSVGAFTGWTGALSENPQFSNAEGVSQATNQACNGGYLSYTPLESQIGKDIYYQCYIHEYMGNRINIVAQGSTTAPPTTTTGGTTGGDNNSGAHLQHSVLVYLMTIFCVLVVFHI